MPSPFVEIQRSERDALADQLSTLTTALWRTPTLCDAWDVEDVVAHLVAGASTGMVAWVGSIVRARFDADVHNQRLVEKYRGATPHETLDRFAAMGPIRLPSANSPAGLGELIVHGEDVRRPLGLTHAPDPDGLLAVARFFATKDFAVNSRSLVRGLSLRATDAGFRHGSGPEVSGPLLSLVMVMAGRAAHLDDLGGDGLPELRRRIQG